MKPKYKPNQIADESSWKKSISYTDISDKLGILSLSQKDSPANITSPSEIPSKVNFSESNPTTSEHTTYRFTSSPVISEPLKSFHRGLKLPLNFKECPSTSQSLKSSFNSHSVPSTSKEYMQSDSPLIHINSKCTSRKSCCTDTVPDIPSLTLKGSSLLKFSTSGDNFKNQRTRIVDFDCRRSKRHEFTKEQHIQIEYAFTRDTKTQVCSMDSRKPRIVYYQGRNGKLKCKIKGN